MTNKTEMVHITEIRNGDTIVTNTGWATVNRKNINTSVMGTTIFGETFRESKGMVERVLFRVWRNGQVISWNAQV